MLTILCVYLKLYPPALAFRLPPMSSQFPMLPSQDPSFAHLATHCAHLTQLPASSYHARLDNLAQALQSLHASAYVAEPGANAQYYVNVSRDDWQLSDRPFLLVIVPEARGRKQDIGAKIFALVPAFESPRAMRLSIPAPPGTSITWLAYAEDESPYKVISRALGIKGKGVIYVDERMRHFIVEAFSRTVWPVVRVRAAPNAITRIREKKDSKEIELMRCANEVTFIFGISSHSLMTGISKVTLLAIRDVHQHIRIGMREVEIQSLMLSALSTAGLTSPTALILTGRECSPNICHVHV